MPGWIEKTARAVAWLLILGGAGVCATTILSGCTTVKRGFKMKNAYDIRAEGRPELEARVREHVDYFLAHPKFKSKDLKFDGDIVIRTVAVKKKDRLGVPYWNDKAKGRVGGITLYTGKHLPVVIAVATVDKKWDERTLRHECAHAILLWNGIKGHPREYRTAVPLWY